MPMGRGCPFVGGTFMSEMGSCCCDPRVEESAPAVGLVRGCFPCSATEGDPEMVSMAAPRWPRQGSEQAPAENDVENRSPFLSDFQMTPESW